MSMSLISRELFQPADMKKIDQSYLTFTHRQTMEKSDEHRIHGARLLLNTKLGNKDSSSEKADFMNKSVSHYKIKEIGQEMYILPVVGKANILLVQTDPNPVSKRQNSTRFLTINIGLGYRHVKKQCYLWLLHISTISHISTLAAHVRITEGGCC